MLHGVGLEEAEVLRRARLPGDLFARQEIALDPEQYYRFWNAMDEASGGPSFAVDLVSGMSADVFDPVLFAAFCSPDMNTALARIRQFKPLIGPLAIDVSISREHTTIAIGFSDIDLSPPASLVMAEIAFFVQFARLATRDRIVPLAATSTIDLASDKRLSDFLGVAPSRAASVSVKFSSVDAEKPFITENPRMWDFFEPGLKKRLGELGSKALAADRVRSALLELLPSGKAKIGETARHLATSPRTLQRRLMAEGTSYQAVLDRVREELAMYYLRNSSLPSAQISFLLGFKDPNSFFRAFHAWSGVTPDSVRADRNH